MMGCRSDVMDYESGVAVVDFEDVKVQGGNEIDDQPQMLSPGNLKICASRLQIFHETWLHSLHW